MKTRKQRTRAHGLGPSSCHENTPPLLCNIQILDPYTARRPCQNLRQFSSTWLKGQDIDGRAAKEDECHIGSFYE